MNWMDRVVRLTPKRMSWLKLLEEGSREREKGLTGNNLGQIGWVEDNLVMRADSEPISFEEATKRWGLYERWNHVIIKGERLTEAGRTILKVGKVGKKYGYDRTPDSDVDPDPYAVIAKPKGYDEGLCWALVWSTTPCGKLIKRHCMRLPAGRDLHTCTQHADLEEDAAVLDLKTMERGR